MVLNAKNFGLAAGIWWGFSILVMTLVSAGTGYAAGFLNVIAGIYPGYSISLFGSIIGLVYGFIDGFVGFFVLIWLYNWLEAKK